VVQAREDQDWDPEQTNENKNNERNIWPFKGPLSEGRMIGIKQVGEPM
jgi:hypothetical protein